MSMIKTILNRKIGGVSAADATAKVGGMGNVINYSLGGVMGVSMYNDARAEGKGAIASAAEAGITAAFYTSLGLGASLLLAGGQMGYEGGKALVKTGFEKERQYQKLGTQSPFSNGTFVDSQQAYTMRQAGMTMIQQNSMNMKKTVMGNEAMHMHR